MNTYLRFATLVALAVVWSVPKVNGAPQVSFNREVRPILSDRCFQCHGPDKNKRKAGLRLDTGEGAQSVLVPGDPGKSALYQRVTSADPKEQMPPPATGHRLTQAQIHTLKRWIEEGAAWQPHWSLVPPVRPPVPEVRQRQWVRNPVDAFILERLEREGLSPSPEADKAALLRRVTLDLTGLPPTPAEVVAFLGDQAPDAYDRVVERLLQSPRYGERMASRWLDAARYADTSGYQSDGERHMWRWRDGVIGAFNRNQPFDQFTLEQLAGDLIPGATLEQRVASGFNRNHRGNAEGGIVPEEYAVEYVVDRVETTATVWLGLTLGCTRCHDHKYDPFSQKEFYQLYAFFNNIPEKGRAIKIGNSPPYIPAPTPEQSRQLHDLERRLAAAERRWAALQPGLASAQADWEKSRDVRTPVAWSHTRNLLARIDTHGRDYLEAGDVGPFGFFDKFSLAARVRPREARGGTIVSRMTDAEKGDGYYLTLDNGKVQLHLVKRWLDDALRVETEQPLEPGRWYHVAATYDGSRVAAGVQLYIDGQPARVRVLLDELNQTFATKEPLRIGGGGGPEARFRGKIDEVRVYDDVLTPEEVAVVAATEPVAETLARPAAARTARQAAVARAYFLDQQAPAVFRAAHRRVQDLRRQGQRFLESLPTVMVMQELPVPRPAFVLKRGEYDKPGERVEREVPKALPPWPVNRSRDRLGLARWLVDPGNPLTARVAVNRIWQMLFGNGLVKTVDDFGAQGEAPTHPELLDWLAAEYVRTGWDTKALLRTLVTSASYRQSSRVRPALGQRDPENRLLARGPRTRLSAEMVRDQALAASGLLVERLGGPSVKPYQPDGLWKELTGTEDYVQDHGEKLYRRSLYTFWKRTVAPPQMLTFDAAGRETCVVRESRTNTPLQALTLLNDVTYVEAARVLAERLLKEGGSTPEERLAYGFRLVTGRSPRPAELRILGTGLQAFRTQYRNDPEAARRLVSTGEYPRDKSLDVRELAAYAATAGLLLNLDEAITKE